MWCSSEGFLEKEASWIVLAERRLPGLALGLDREEQEGVGL